jgi:hypothetical protein
MLQQQQRGVKATSSLGSRFCAPVARRAKNLHFQLALELKESAIVKFLSLVGAVA